LSLHHKDWAPTLPKNLQQMQVFPVWSRLILYKNIHISQLLFYKANNLQQRISRTKTDTFLFAIAILVNLHTFFSGISTSMSSYPIETNCSRVEYRSDWWRACTYYALIGGELVQCTYYALIGGELVRTTLWLVESLYVLRSDWWRACTYYASSKYLWKSVNFDKIAMFKVNATLFITSYCE